MPTTDAEGTKLWQRRDRRTQFLIWSAWFGATAIFVFCWQLISDKTTWFFVLDAPEQAGDLLGRMGPPKWS